MWRHRGRVDVQDEDLINPYPPVCADHRGVSSRLGSRMQITRRRSCGHRRVWMILRCGRKCIRLSYPPGLDIVSPHYRRGWHRSELDLEIGARMLKSRVFRRRKKSTQYTVEVQR
jgi:hypothetical protein